MLHFLNTMFQSTSYLCCLIQLYSNRQQHSSNVFTAHTVIIVQGKQCSRNSLNTFKEAVPFKKGGCQHRFHCTLWFKDSSRAIQRIHGLNHTSDGACRTSFTKVVCFNFCITQPIIMNKLQTIYSKNHVPIVSLMPSW